MQSFFLKIYNQIKNKLCQRRNTKATINPYASIERTDVLVRNTRLVHIPSNPVNRLSNINLNNNQGVQSSQPIVPPQQIIEKKQVQKKRCVKPSTFIVQFPQDETDEENSQDSYNREILIQYEMKISAHNREIEKELNKLGFLKEQDIKRKKHFWKNVYYNYSNQQLDKDISGYIDQQQGDREQNYDENALQKMYKNDIQEIRELKYSLQLKDYPQISFEAYSNIRNLWIYGRKQPNHIIKKMNLKILQKLTARSFRTLSFGSWLNDQIINAYLQIIDMKSLQIGKQYKVLNSFFAQTTFSKTQDMISRALKRKNITPINKIIIAINNGNHWFFAQIINSRIVIYDSIKKQQNYYLQSETTGSIFRNIIEFADWFYKTKHSIVVHQRYPQQQNSYDCGMFLLCGIKDMVRDYKEWSFCQMDISFKRVQVAKELLDQQITGF